MKRATFLAHVTEAARQRNILEEQMLSTVREWGFEALEVHSDILCPDTIRRLKDADLSISCVYRLCDYNQPEEADAIRRFLYDVAEAGSRQVLILPADMTPGDKAPQIARLAEHLHRTCEEAAPYGIRVLLEDYDGAGSPCCQLADLRTLLEAVPALGLAFDTGNFLYSGQDTLEAYARLKGRLCHLHLKDRCLTPLHPNDQPMVTPDGRALYPCAAGKGILPIATILQKAQEQGYDGYAVTEHFGAADQYTCLQEDAKLKL